MVVEKFNPDRMYGFAVGTGRRVFFHVDVFDRGQWPGIEVPPPPIVGEPVYVTMPTGDTPEGREPRALRVTRVSRPLELRGVVEAFDVGKGWGFAAGEDGRSYYLHRSEVEEGRIPIKGRSCTFIAGYKRDRPRACYVRLENG